MRLLVFDDKKVGLKIHLDLEEGEVCLEDANGRIVLPRALIPQVKNILHKCSEYLRDHRDAKQTIDRIEGSKPPKE